VASRVIRQFRQTIPNLDIPKNRTLRELFTEVMSTSISSNLAPARLHVLVLNPSEAEASMLKRIAVVDDVRLRPTAGADRVGAAATEIPEQSVDANSLVTAAPAADKDGKLPDAAAESSPTACFGPETLVRVAVPGTMDDWTRKKFKHITSEDHVWGWLQVNATTVARQKVKVLCVMAPTEFLQHWS